MENKSVQFQKIEDAIATLKTINDPAVIEQANQIADGLAALRVAPQITEFVGEIHTFDKGLVEKYGIPVARVIEFATLMYVAAKMHFLGM